MIESFLQFLNASPTSFHCVEEIVRLLTRSNFIPLLEQDRWKIDPEKGYFVVKGGQMIAAFRMPQKALRDATIFATHIDSPCLKIRSRPEKNHHGIEQFGTEIYGGPLLNSWLDRDLYLAGRIVVSDSRGKKRSHIVRLEDHPVIIPQLPIHFDRTANEKGLVIQKQESLKPIFSLNSEGGSLEKDLKKRYAFENLLGYDLFLVPLERANCIGFRSELIASYRLDNLTSVYAALLALMDSPPTDQTLQIVFFWDHEEIGSKTAVGADSCFADELLERICLSLEIDRQDFLRMKSRSTCLSVDLTHGFHPNFPNMYDLQNVPFLGQGPVLKWNASQKYATDSETFSTVFALAEKEKISMQTFITRSDISSGSTVGSLMASQLGIRTVDLGIAGWAMHSIREVIAATDETSLYMLLKAAMKSSLNDHTETLQ